MACGAGPADTVAFVLLRHASAVGKDAWAGDDRDRPLDKGGVDASELLARLLSCFGPRRVISSPAERCVATVRPYAALTGADLQIATVLSSHQTAPEPQPRSAPLPALSPPLPPPPPPPPR